MPATHAMPRVIHAGELELDCLSRLVRRQGRPLALSAKELAVLEALISASPGYLSAEQLLEKAWDENADLSQRLVTVTIPAGSGANWENPSIDRNEGGWGGVPARRGLRP